MKEIYDSLSPEIEALIMKNNTFEDTAIRRYPTEKDKGSVLRPPYVRDCEKIMNCPYYNRYTDKTQVFSFCKNDDISRRALHVQLVSRIARNIGRLLGLDTELIEAIALGHDMGHTPFGHTGEKILNKIYHQRTGRVFLHNLHSVRVLDRIFRYNISLQTLDGILCHNGEMELSEYHPAKLGTFEDFDREYEESSKDASAALKLIPKTLEGCVVRISDIIAYVGKDRQDAQKLNMIEADKVFDDGILGNFNASIINNLVVNIVENSFGKDYICMDKKYFEALKKAKRDNYKHIYETEKVSGIYSTLEPMFSKLYEKLSEDLKKGRQESYIFSHHIDFIKLNNKFYGNAEYDIHDTDQVVTDYIASMTDDYFVALYEHLFPGEQKVSYKNYFSEEGEESC